MTPITIVTSIEAPEELIEQAIASWDDYRIFYTKQKGYVSSKLLKSNPKSGKYNLITISEWESKESQKAALSSPELARIAERQPEFTRKFALYETIRG